jgi:hypothetical protein
MEQQRRYAKDGKQWLSSSVLSNPALDNLYAINRIYLDALTTRVVYSNLPREPGPLIGRVAESIACLDCERRTALARSPFSLFDAQFGNGSFWTFLTVAFHEPSVPAIE